MENKRFNYYVGIEYKDKALFDEFILALNTETDNSYHVEVVNKFDDPHGYHVLVVKGTWNSYTKFITMRNSFCKSLEHFEDA